MSTLDVHASALVPGTSTTSVHRTFDYGPLVGLPRFVHFALCGEIPAISADQMLRSLDDPITQCPANAFFAFAGGGGALACESESVGNGPVTKALLPVFPNR